MKTKIHPEYKKTKVTCAGCGTSFESYSTVSEMNVDVCSNCHPFYTGKQKLVDTAGRVDRFRAKTAAAEAKKEALSKKAQKAIKKSKSTKESTKVDTKAALKKLKTDDK